MLGVDFGGERAGVKTALAREHGKAAYTPSPEAVEVRLTVPVEGLVRTGAGVK